MEAERKVRSMVCNKSPTLTGDEGIEQSFYPAIRNTKRGIG